MRKIKKLLCVLVTLSLYGTMCHNLMVSASNTNMQAGITTNASQDTNKLSYICMSQGGKTSYNVSDNTYKVWSRPIYSNIIENKDGSFVRVEAIKYYDSNISNEVIMNKNLYPPFEMGAEAKP